MIHNEIDDDKTIYPQWNNECGEGNTITVKLGSNAPVTIGPTGLSGTEATPVTVGQATTITIDVTGTNPVSKSNTLTWTANDDGTAYNVTNAEGGFGTYRPGQSIEVKLSETDGVGIVILGTMDLPWMPF